MGVLDKIKYFPDAPAEDTSVSGAFAQGLRSGVTSAEGQLAAIGGLASPSLRKSSMELQQRAAQEAEGLPTFKDMRLGENGMRWAAGTLGQMLPQAVPAVAAGMATGGAFLPAMAAGTAATVPFTLGSQLQRQDADPANAAATPGMRAGAAFLPAVGSAVAQNLIPAGVAMRMAGKGGQTTVGGALMRGAMDVPANAAASGVAEGIAQWGDNRLNPNAGYNLGAVEDATIEGAGAGGLFGVAGAAGHLAHRAAGMPGRAVDAAAGMIPQGVKDRAGRAVDAVGEYGGRALDAAGEYGGRALDAAMDRGGQLADAVAKHGGPALDKGLATGGKLLDQGGDIASKVAKWGEGSIKQRLEDTRRWATEYMNEDASDGSFQAHVQEVIRDPGKKANQMWMAAQAFGRVAAKEIKDADIPGQLRELHRDVMKRGGEADRLQKLAEGQDTAPSEAHDAAPEVAQQAYDKDNETNMQLVARVSRELLSKVTDPKVREQLSQALNSLGDKAAQQYVAAVHQGEQAKTRTGAAIDRFTAKVKDQQAKDQQAKPAAGGAKRSDDYSGARAAVGRAVRDVLGADHPALADPAKVDALSRALIPFVDDVANGKVFDGFERLHQINALYDIAGEQSGDVLNAVHSLVRGADVDSRKFYENAAQLTAIGQGRQRVLQTLRKNLPEELQGLVRSHQLSAVADALNRWATKTSGTKDPAQAKFDNERVIGALRDWYGDKADIVLAAVEKSVAKDTAVFERSSVKHDDEGNEIGVRHGDDEGTREFKARDAAEFVDEYPAKGGLYLHPDHTDESSAHGSATSQAMQRMAAKYRDGGAQVIFRSVGELGRDNPQVKAQFAKLVEAAEAEGMDTKTARQFASTELQKYGAVSVERDRNELRLNHRELAALHPKKGHSDGPWVLHTRGKGVADNVNIDAVKLINAMRKRMDSSGDHAMRGAKDGNTLQRDVRALHEGVAALQELLGHRIELPDTLQIRPGSDGLTFGEARELVKSKGTDYGFAALQRMADKRKLPVGSEARKKFIKSDMEGGDARESRAAQTQVTDDAALGDLTSRELRTEAAKTVKSLREAREHLAQTVEKVEQEFADLKRNEIRFDDRMAREIRAKEREAKAEVRRLEDHLDALKHEHEFREGDPEGTDGDVNAGVAIGKVRMRELEADYWKAKDAGDEVKAQEIWKQVGELSYNREASTAEQKDFGTGRTAVDPFGPTHDVMRGRGQYSVKPLPDDLVDIGPKWGVRTPKKGIPAGKLSELARVGSASDDAVIITNSDGSGRRERPKRGDTDESLAASRLIRSMSKIEQRLGAKLKALIELGHEVDRNMPATRHDPFDGRTFTAEELRSDKSIVHQGTVRKYPQKWVMSDEDHAALREVGRMTETIEMAPTINRLAAKYKIGTDEAPAPERPGLPATNPADAVLAKSPRLDEMLAKEDFSALKTKEQVDKLMALAERRYKELQDVQTRLDDVGRGLPVTQRKALTKLHEMFGPGSVWDRASMYDGIEGGTPDPKAVAAKKAAFVERALSGDKALIAEVASSTDAKGLQRAVHAVNEALRVESPLAVGLSHFGRSINSAATMARLMMGEGESAPAYLRDAQKKLVGEYRRRTAKASRLAPDAARALRGISDQMEALNMHAGANPALVALMDSGRAHMGDAMRLIAEHADDSGSKRIAEALASRLGDVPVKFERLESGMNGLYHPERHEVYVSSGMRDHAAGVLMHEAIHAATSRGIETSPEVSKAAYALMEHVANHSKELRQAYGLRNAHEFIAEGLTNKGFQDKLRKIPASAEAQGMIGKLKSAWDSFVDLVRGALGLKPEDRNALTQLLDLSSAAMKSDAGSFSIAEAPSSGIRIVPRDLITRAVDRLQFASPDARRALEQKLGDHEMYTHGQRVTLAMMHRYMEEGNSPPLDASTAERFYDTMSGMARQGGKSMPHQLGGLAATADAINKRLGELVQSEDVRYGMATKKYSAERTDSNATGPIDRKAVGEHLEKVLGPDIRLAWQDIAHAGEFSARDGIETIALSAHSLNPMGTAYHESLHAFFRRLSRDGHDDIRNVMEKSASSVSVMNQLRKLLKDEPDALKQLDDPEERAAYMYQFWAMDRLKVGEQAQGVFSRIAAYFRKVLGIWSNDERALKIMEYFHSGEYQRNAADVNAVARAAMEPGRNAAIEKVKAWSEPLRNLHESLMVAGGQRLRDTGVPALKELADIMKMHGTEEGQDAGFIPAARQERSRRMNELMNLIGEHSEAAHADALEALQNGRETTTPEGKFVRGAVRRALRQMLSYMQEAGVEIEHITGDNAAYFPRSWDPSYIRSHQAEFRAMLQKYVDNGQFHGDPVKLMHKLVASDGAEFTNEHDKPGMQFAKERLLKFITHEDAAPFMRKNLMEIMNSYITQGTRRAEWSRRLGGENEGLHDILARAKRQGATDKQVETAMSYVRAVDGTLGDDINPTARRLMGDIIVYQNIRLLPLAIFSSVVDPAGIVVRGGTMRDAFTTFKRGVKEMVKNFQDKPTEDDATQFAAMVGTIDNAMLTRALGASYSQGMVGDLGRSINDKFFRYNLMEQFNNSMRVGATEAALGFIARHAKGVNEHSTRYLGELGLTKDDVQVGPDGRLKVLERDGLSLEHAARMKAAVNRWVDGAVLRPDAADKPLWMSDPHWALISHLKQFVFSFQETILKRVAHEIEHGNYTPAYAVASYVPIMIAADMVKGLIQGGGSQPQWKEGWGLAEYFNSGVERSGLWGSGQFVIDGVEGVMGTGGFGSLTGPTIEQVTDAVRVMGGREQFGSFAVKSMPANALYGGIVGGASPDPKFAD